MHTKDILAAALIEAGLADMAKRATRGWYHDFLSPLDAPSLTLAEDLQAAGTPAALVLLKRHLNGDFDASWEESEAWAASDEGRSSFASLTPNREQRRKQARTAPKPPERLGDAPIEEQYREKMNAIASVLDGVLNDDAKGADRKVGFVLLVFPFGDAEGARTNFISNGADRRDVVTLMKEMIARFEGQPDPRPGHA